MYIIYLFQKIVDIQTPVNMRDKGTENLQGIFNKTKDEIMQDNSFKNKSTTL